jgi:hypothetical protein
VHFHCCVSDGVFALGQDGQIHFAEAAALTPEDLATVQQQVHARVLRWFARAGDLDPADAGDMAGWAHGGGCSVDASLRIEGQDRTSLERLLRYCARSAFALERLEPVRDDKIVYRLPRPQPDGRSRTAPHASGVDRPAGRANSACAPPPPPLPRGARAEFTAARRPLGIPAPQRGGLQAVLSALPRLPRACLTPRLESSRDA